MDCSPSRYLGIVLDTGSNRVNTDRGINTDRELQTSIRRLPYGVTAKVSISSINCTFGFLANCILLDSAPLKQHDIPVHSDHPSFSVPFCENIKEQACLNQNISLHALW